jgi:aminopeptidase N
VGIVVGNALRMVGADVLESLALFSDLFGPYPFERMVVTRIPYGHGQGFPGLIHLSASTFGGGRRGVSQAFRAHEVSHQWWGHLVGWKSYRDQWLSEGFAEYSGALFAAERVHDPRMFHRMLESWRRDILHQGNLQASLGMERFGYPREMMRWSKGSAAGPISLGYRLSASDAPLDYQLLVYEKGAWVVHMARMLLYDFHAGNDAPFRAMIREFVAAHLGSNPSTADFRRALEKHWGGDLGWFFDQWVDGTAIPRYRWAWTTVERDGMAVLRLRVRQEVDGRRPFRMVVPVRARFAPDHAVVFRIEVDGPERTFDLPVPRRPAEVEFNVADAVLCEARSEEF